MAEMLSTMSQVVVNNGCRIVLEAVDPATGAVISDVVISDVAIYAADFTPEPADANDGATPLWLPLPADAPGTKPV